MKFKRTVAALLAAAAGLAGCAAEPPEAPSAVSLSSQQAVSTPVKETENRLKYVFLFIGDGMSYPQFQAASDYLGAMAQGPDAEILQGGEALSFMNFPVAGSAVTFDSTSFCPDSASTATSISTGHKTHSGTINMDESKTVSYETIAEKVKKQLGYKAGIISTVNLNHATPAAFYAHQASRNSYYEISQELIDSRFEYFAGGGLKQTTGAGKDKTDSYELAEQAGYQVIKTQAEALTGADKAIIIRETLADSDALSYDNDRAEAEWSLRDYVKKASRYWITIPASS